MIYVSQGHEKGIGLEILFKAILQLPKRISSQIELHAERKSIQETVNSLDFKIVTGDKTISIAGVSIGFCEIECKSGSYPSTESLLSILKIIKENDILITLPTSKDQLILNTKHCSGYTAFFRNYFGNRNISMLFHSSSLDVLLLTDHIPLNLVSTSITKELVTNKIDESLLGLNKYFEMPEELIISGINPHAGEDGILGTEDPIIAQGVEPIKTKYQNTKIMCPLPGDTLHFHRNINRRQLYVYAYHDQGLTFFKEKFGLFGINVTLGLPFLRLSVDHGTAFDLYGKNKADSAGLLHVIYTADKVLNR